MWKFVEKYIQIKYDMILYYRWDYIWKKSKYTKEYFEYAKAWKPWGCTHTHTHTHTHTGDLKNKKIKYNQGKIVSIFKN